MSEPREVIIDGVRYVPACEAVAGLDDLRVALEDVFWGPGYNLGQNRSEGLFVRIYDGGEGMPLNEFMDELAVKLTQQVPHA